MAHPETTLRHVWLAGLGLLARVRRKIERVEASVEREKPVAFVTTQKVAKKAVKKAASPSSGSRRAGERESQRRIAGRGR
jgi:hypothetical protein